MASGKTTVGKKLAEVLNYKFIDTDEFIENETKMSINHIFKEYGEEYFRDLEEKAVIACSDSENAVISCGGGVVLRKSNVDNLRKKGIVFNLNPSNEVIASRLSKAADTRPLLNKNDVDDAIKKFEGRKPYYDNCDYKINIEIDKSVESVSEEILEKYRKEV